MEYDLTFKWNLINKQTSKQQEPERHENKERTDSDQRRGGKWGKKGKGRVKEHVQRTHGHERWGRNCLWEWGMDGAGKSNGRQMGTTVTEQQ